jgi:hypothetical protein
MPLSFRGKALLNGSASIAIWNRKKSIIVIAAGVWAANVGFLIHSKPLHPVCYRLLMIAFKYSNLMVLGVTLVNNQSTRITSQTIWTYHTLRFTLRGHLWNAPA